MNTLSRPVRCPACGEACSLDPTPRRGYRLHSADGLPHAHVCPRLRQRVVGVKAYRGRAVIKLQVSYRERGAA